MLLEGFATLGAPKQSWQVYLRMSQFKFVPQPATMEKLYYRCVARAGSPLRVLLLLVVVVSPQCCRGVRKLQLRSSRRVLPGQSHPGGVAVPEHAHCARLQRRRDSGVCVWMATLAGEKAGKGKGGWLENPSLFLRVVIISSPGSTGFPHCRKRWLDSQSATVSVHGMM